MQRAKHILFLSSWYPSRVHPFNGDFVQRHALAASEINQISVLHAVKDARLNKRYEIEITENNNVREIIVYYRNSKFRPLNYLKRLQAFKRGLKHIENYDLIHLNVTYPAGVVALYLHFFYGKRYVITEHWTGFRKDLFNKVNFFERLIIKSILKNSSKLLPVSNDLAKNMLRVSGKIPYQVIPNVVFTDLFKLLPVENRSKKKFLHLSSLNYAHKNIQGMLNVAKRLADDGYEFEFHIGGTGKRDEMNDFIVQENLQNHVYTFGALSYDQVPAKMSQYDTFVLFSNYENQPCVQTESFACGLSFIGTDVGGIKEFLPEGFGILIEKGNEDQLYNAMKSIVQQKQFTSKEQMSNYAKNNFSPQIIAEKFDNVYKEILNE